MIKLKSDREIAIMRRAGAIAAEVLESVAKDIRPGVTTAALDEKAFRLIKKLGGEPAFKGYRKFPATLCTSINEVVVHGIPGKQRAREGDILSVDVGVELDGYYADAAVTVPVGKISREAARLTAVTEEALAAGIDMVRPGNRLSDVSCAVQRHVESNGFTVIRDFVGHGIGSELHEPPEVPNFGVPDTGPRLEKGMVLALEPMVCTGRHEIEIREDGWTAVTKDGGLAAHFEHTVAVTDKAAEILTICQKKTR